jgi:hypothetical protein
MGKQYESCYLSEKGHNNFWYPSQKRSFIKHNCEYTRLSWLGGTDRNLIPLKVSKSCISAFKREETNEFIVVWIKKDKLPLGTNN